MPNPTSTAADIRQRRDHHAAIQASAEARRASILADRADVIAVLTSAELDEIDDENDHLAVVIERAASRVAALAPALAAAEKREAAADAHEARAADNLAFAETRREMVETLKGSPEMARSAAVAALAARAPTVDVNPALFDEPRAPVVVRVDEAEWHRQREARLRAEGGRTAMEPAGASASLNPNQPGPALSLSR